MLRSRKFTVRAFFDALNARSLERAERLMARDFVYIDSCQNCITGRDNCLELLSRLWQVDPTYRQELQTIALVAGQALVQGRVIAADPVMSSDELLFSMKFHRGKISFFQSFRGDDPPAMAKLLMPELALPLSDFDAPEQSAHRA